MVGQGSFRCSSSDTKCW